jgi:hypothetical protein
MMMMMMMMMMMTMMMMMMMMMMMTMMLPLCSAYGFGQGAAPTWRSKRSKVGPGRADLMAERAGKLASEATR